MGFPNHVDTATIFSHCSTARGDKPNSMLCSKNFFIWTHKHEFVNINWGGIKASTASNFLWVKNPDYSRGRFSIRKTCFSWRWPQVWLVQGFSPLSPASQKGKHSYVEAKEHSFSWGGGAKGRRKLWGYDEGILFLWFDEKERILCPAWFRLCWRAHWRLFEEASFKEEGKKSHGLVLYPHPPLSYQISRLLQNSNFWATRP